MSAITTKSTQPSALSEFWYYFSRNKGAVIGFGIFLLVLLTAIFAPLIAPHDPNVPFDGMQRVPPVWSDKGNPMFLLGTDAVGRDMLSRLIYGTRFSLFIGLVVASLSAVAGVLLLSLIHISEPTRPY